MDETALLFAQNYIRSLFENTASLKDLDDFVTHIVRINSFNLSVHAKSVTGFFKELDAREKAHVDHYLNKKFGINRLTIPYRDSIDAEDLQIAYKFNSDYGCFDFIAIVYGQFKSVRVYGSFEEYHRFKCAIDNVEFHLPNQEVTN